MKLVSDYYYLLILTLLYKKYERYIFAVNTLNKKLSKVQNRIASIATSNSQFSGLFRIYCLHINQIENKISLC